jgi:hypothetical protein
LARLASERRGPRPSVQLPEPERLWVRYAPRTWRAGPVPGPVPDQDPDRSPTGPGAWLDLARGRLGAPGTGDPPELPAGPFDDVLYVPPVDPRDREARAHRDRAIAGILADGTPVLVHLFPGDPPPPDGATPVVDLLGALLARDPRVLGALPEGSAAVWPLIGGLTDGEALREEWLDRLAEAGAAVVQPVVPDLPPEDRRTLAEGRDRRVFDALFHGRPPEPRGFARAAARRGLGIVLPRPLPRPPLRGARQRELGGLLLLAGDLCQRLGRVGRGQAHFRAARWVDRTRYDLRVLAREGNLAVIHWLDPASRAVVEEWAERGASPIVDGLLEEYAGRDAQ